MRVIITFRPQDSFIVHTLKRILSSFSFVVVLETENTLTMERP